MDQHHPAHPASTEAASSGPAGRVSLADRRAVLTAAADALRDLPQDLWQACGSDLGALMGELDDVAALAGGARIAVTAEASERGEVASSQCANTAAWVAAHAPSLAAGSGARRVCALVDQTRNPSLRPVREAVVKGELAVPTGLVVLAEFDKLKDRLIHDALPVVLDGLIGIGAAAGVGDVRKLRPALLARYGAPGELQDDQDRAAAHVALSHAVSTGDGLWLYKLVVDAEAKAIVEASIGPLSAPATTDGQRDSRSAQQRRGQALVEVCRRVNAAAQAAGPFGGHPSDAADATDAVDASEGPEASAEREGGGAPPTAGTSSPVTNPGMIRAALAGIGAGGGKATLLLTMPLADLERRTGAATTLGTLDAPTLIAPDTARRIACDAGLIPVVLGSNGEILDLGRTHRLFTPAQTRALLLRDRHCTFPRCTTPGFWTDAHHLTFWSDGGGTSLPNGALLCQRHHTIVHRDRLTASVTGTRVDWDLTPGSYDRARARGHPDHQAA
ncbi:MAG: HNH endonuclease signature motif containing protein [Dermatophilaceae bacterium]